MEMKTIHQINKYCFPSRLFLLIIRKFKAYHINPSIQNRGRQQSACVSPYQAGLGNDLDVHHSIKQSYQIPPSLRSDIQFRCLTICSVQDLIPVVPIVKSFLIVK